MSIDAEALREAILGLGDVVPPTLRKQGRLCAECGVVVRPGDGGILAAGARFCSEECADEALGPDA